MQFENERTDGAAELFVLHFEDRAHGEQLEREGWVHRAHGGLVWPPRFPTPSPADPAIEPKDDKPE